MNRRYFLGEFGYVEIQARRHTSAPAATLTCSRVRCPACCVSRDRLAKIGTHVGVGAVASV